MSQRVVQGLLGEGRQSIYGDGEIEGRMVIHVGNRHNVRAKCHLDVHNVRAPQLEAFQPLG